MSNTNTFLGTSGINAIYLGNTQIVSAYCGTNRIFPPGDEIKFRNQYQKTGSTNTITITNSVSGLTRMIVNGVEMQPQTTYTFTDQEFADGAYVEFYGEVDKQLNPNFFSGTPVTNATGYTNITNAYARCATLQNFTCKNWCRILNRDGFLNCTGLTGISGTEIVRTLGSASFTNVPARELSFPNLASTTPYSISNVFSGCGMQYLTVGGDNGIKLGSNFVLNCTGLTNVTIGSGVTEIGNVAFNVTGSNRMPIDFITIEYRDAYPTIYNYSFNDLAQNGTLFIMNPYMTGTSWLEYEPFKSNNWTIATPF